MAWADPQALDYPDMNVVDVEPLGAGHPDVVTAAVTLAKEIV